MKNLKYVVVIVLGLLAAGCTDEPIAPKGDDDPIVIPPRPPKP